MGQYITIETRDLSSNDGSYHKEMSEALYLNLKEMIPRNAKVLWQVLGILRLRPIPWGLRLSIISGLPAT